MAKDTSLSVFSEKAVVTGFIKDINAIDTIGIPLIKFMSKFDNQVKIMNKAEFITFISKESECTKTKAEKTIDMFTSSVIDALGQGKEISLIGFGHFSISDVAAREGRNPRTGEKMKIGAYKQPKFKVGQKLKDACNQQNKIQFPVD